MDVIACGRTKRSFKLCISLVFPQDLIKRKYPVPTWIITIALLTLALILGLGLLLLARQRKRERLELRLLSGRRQLLGRELEACLAELDAIDQQAIAALRQKAEGALDQLHVVLVERQAHLLNYEDMAHLQQCKFDLLAAPPPAQDPALDAAPRKSAERASRKDSERPAQKKRDEDRDRSALESDLLSKISQLQDGKKSKK